MPEPLDDAQRRLRHEVEKAMIVVVNDLLSKAVNDAPIETGRLRESGEAFPNPQHPPVWEGNRLVGKVTFSTPYAAAQHEGHATQLNANPPRSIIFRNHPLGGGSKYLEKNLKAMGPRYRAVLEAAKKKALG